MLTLSRYVGWTWLPFHVLNKRVSCWSTFYVGCRDVDIFHPFVGLQSIQKVPGVPLIDTVTGVAV